MKTRFSLLALAVASAFGGQSFAQTAETLPAGSDTRWFIELSGNPTADGGKSSTVLAEQAAFRAAAQAAGIKLTERRAYSALFNGFSVDVSNADRAKLARLPGVRAMYPVETVDAPTPAERAQSALDMQLALGLTGANVAQNSLGLTGRGIKVGIIDSGIDIDHPAFGGSGTPGTTSFPTARVATGWDFVGDNYNTQGTPDQQIPRPDANPDDCGGHGTHVAGIVGGNGGGLVGVAPEVTFGAYRVFGCNGSSSADVIMAAMERALLDGMQVINQSLGASRQWPQYPTAVAAARLAKKGVVMVASIGNNGPGGSQPDGLWAAGAPGVGDGVIGVASFDNGQRSFNVGSSINGYSAGSPGPVAPTSGTDTLVRTGTQTATTDGCTPFTAGSLTGQMALIRRGGCTFYVKSLNAQNAGAKGVVLYNNAAGGLAPGLTPTTPADPAITIPVVMVAQVQGNALDSAIAASSSSSVTMTWTNNGVGYPFGTGGLISGFSSFGLGADLSMKPQLGAPGGGIVSSYPLEAAPTGLATLSGTSMSSPHVAGVAALVLQAVPTAALGRTTTVISRNAPPAINMMTRLMNTAKAQPLAAVPTLGIAEHSFRQGAGMVDVVAAVQSQQFVVPAQIATGESAAGPTTQRLTVRNDGSSAVTYTLGHYAGAAAAPNVPFGTTATNPNGTSWNIGGALIGPATVGFSSATVMVPAKGAATVDVTITANTGLPARSLYGGHITLTPVGAGTALNVPYAGFVGDYQSTPVLRATSLGLPWLASLSAGTFTRCTDALPCASFSMSGGSTPFLLTQFQHPARSVKLEALDAASGAVAGEVFTIDYLGRNAGPGTGSRFDFTWDGNFVGGGVAANGNYRLRLTVLKPLGDASVPGHTEVFTSPVFTVARPL